MGSKNADLGATSVTTLTPRKHRLKTADRRTVELSPYYRSTAIACMCAECMGWQCHPIDCTDELCPLYPFRGRTERTLHGDKREKLARRTP